MVDPSYKAAPDVTQCLNKRIECRRDKDQDGSPKFGVNDDACYALVTYHQALRGAKAKCAEQSCESFAQCIDVKD
jgi:hypothetical protein